MSNEQESTRRHDLEPSITVTKEQIQAMLHAVTGDELVAVSMMALTEQEFHAQTAHPDRPNGNLVIDSHMTDGWLLVGYDWNTEGCPAWLAPDGGWHYQPNETGHYPWKTS